MKKSLYVFLCSLLGILLFLIIHRLLVFCYLILISSNPQVFGGGLNYLELLAIDYSTLILTLFLGSWYGIWLGLKWFEAIYERGEHGGFVDHLVKTYWPSPNKNNFHLNRRLQNVAVELKDDVLALENLTKAIKPTFTEKPAIKRRVVRKRAVKTRLA